MSASLTSSAIFSAAGRKLDMVSEYNLFSPNTILSRRYLINSLLLEVEPEINSAWSFQNLPWNYVEVVFLNAFFQPTIMFSGVSSFLQSSQVFPV